MSKIKTRESVKNVKVLDKAAVASENMKKAFIRTKEQGQNLVDDGQASPSEYASDNLQYAVEDITQEAGHVLDELIRIENGASVDGELMENIALITGLIDGLYEKSPT